MRRCLRAGALSALCLLLAFAAPCMAYDRCPALDAARSVAAALRDSKEAERAIEAAIAQCADLGGTPRSAAPAPAFDTEVEPNDEPADSSDIDFHGGVAVIAGEINGAGDVDFYRIFLDGAARVWLQTDTGGDQKLGGNSRDTVMDLWGQDAATLIEEDDDDGNGSGGDGTTETGLASSIAGRTIGPTAVYIRVRGFSDTYVVRPYRLLVLMTESAGTAESESNNTAGTADALAGPLALVTGAIGAAGDSDYYAMTLTEGSIFVVSVDADPERNATGTDLVVELRDPADQLIQSIDSSISGSLVNPASEAANYTIPANGTYYVRVRHFSAGGTGNYHLAAGTLLANPKPHALEVDGSGNGVWEPGETVVVRPSWGNIGTGAVSMTGVLTSPSGPAGATYTVTDFVSDYGTINPGFAGDCGVDLNCYSISVDDPPSRPAVHWDASALELLSVEVSRKWELHIGGSFADVPAANLFYAYIETLLHNGITGGCSGTTYCPGNPALRKQMAVFVLKALLGPTYTPPAAAGVFTDVPQADPFAPWIEELYNRSVVAGCGPGPAYCPDNPVIRQQMALFLLKTLEGSGYTPPACTGIFPDVPCSNPFAAWIEELFDRGIAAGCGNGNFCPANPTTRGQMAPFLGKTFGLKLYGP